MQSFQFTLNLRRSNTRTISSANRIPRSYGNSFDLEYCKINSVFDTFMHGKLRRRNFREKKSDFNRSDKIEVKIEFLRTMNNRGNLIHNRLVILAIIIACVLAVFIKAVEGRPHIRHHRGGSHCSRCGPGWGVIRRCARGRDTACRKCPGGTYSPHHSAQPCWNCARCGPGLYEAHPCTPHSDTVCDSCHRPAPDNPDYRQKCEDRARFFLAPEDAESTAEESVLVNEPAYRFQLNDRERLLEKDVEAIMRDKTAAARSEDPRRL